jgi:HEAT repeat protein
MLNDPHPELRRSVCEWLNELSRVAELDEPIRRSATDILAGDNWRGLEQAALLLAALDHKPAAPRLVELVDYGRGEVRVAAAWGAKMLAIPETLPALLAIALRRTEARLGQVPVPNDLDDHTAHLLEFFGKMKYREAEPLMRQYIPKQPTMGRHSRAAAIWSLGFLHEGVPDEDLAAQLVARLLDNGIPPEFTSVKLMSAVTIARMKAVSQVPALRKFVSPTTPPGQIGMTIRWALMELTGESIPEPEPPIGGMSGWFLEPVGD